ncbi:MAG TPA: hypothetical protein VK137_06795, partial [Planctomycetaceae bacterium]|nr:hypothetical protein [Planctomycetaceae bacterium]
PTRRRDQLVFVTTKPAASPGQPPFETLQVGERVVTHGGVELAAELESLQTAAKTTALTDTSVSYDVAKSTP